eukprot:Blabericola_migrator_1__45@NODE_1010_length_5714_cov_79_058438_g693_i0_p2_GENE_NODE_1010_length_5714_cov_79_058438_g693_i0NODE_1010_length_5714_cov_79_058438_g693_i0_p2_ORF_typecomplete_len399_score55_42Glyco_transf_7C/PF02709_14/5e07Glyco_tranf_2_3/PF13641_6/0_0001_NODE_1010_length_5714_cov_79_058438_g693_i035964792
MMFDWDLSFHWFEDNNDEVPCMSGGLLGISKEWWNHTQGYDAGMKLWGSENIEQSVKTWMAGGEIVVARQSRVAHVFRSTFPYKVDGSAFAINKIRLVEVWFDRWKKHARIGRRYDPDNYETFAGNLDRQKELRRALAGDKTFDWYIRRFRNTFVKKQMIDIISFLIQWTSPEGEVYCLVAEGYKAGIKKDGPRAKKLVLERDCESQEAYSDQKAAWYIYGDVLPSQLPLQAYGRSDVQATRLPENKAVSFNPVYVPANIVGNKYRPTLDFAGSHLCLTPSIQTRPSLNTRSWLIAEPVLSACKPLNPALEFRDLRQWGGFSFPPEINKDLLDLEFSEEASNPTENFDTPLRISLGSQCLTIDSKARVTIQLCDAAKENVNQLFRLTNIKPRRFPTEK